MHVGKVPAPKEKGVKAGKIEARVKEGDRVKVVEVLFRSDSKNGDQPRTITASSTGPVLSTALLGKDVGSRIDLDYCRRSFLILELEPVT